jgi:hypothetical protein
MWFTLIICLDIFLAWLITGWICFFSFYFLVEICKIPDYMFELPFLLMAYAQIPPGFILLARYTPNLILVGVYFMYNLPKSDAFKCWWGWEWLRQNYFHVKGLETIKNAQIRGEESSKLDSPPRIYAVSPHGSYGEAVIIGFTLNLHIWPDAPQPIHKASRGS